MQETAMRMRALVLAATLTCAGLSGMMAPPAEAADRAAGPGVVGYVTADSRYGGKSVSGPVRRGPQGRLEVRLPGGTWLECGRSCSETLRRQTVDFWRNYGRESGGSPDGPGYIQFRW
jgi:hypothetical protein